MTSVAAAAGRSLRGNAGVNGRSGHFRTAARSAGTPIDSF